MNSLPYRNPNRVGRLKALIAEQILIVDGANQLRSKKVKVLRIDRDDVLVQGPLGEGERICVSPLQVVVEGMAVQTVEDEIDETRVEESRHS